MNVVATRPSEAAPMSHGNLPYRHGFPARPGSPIYPITGTSPRPYHSMPHINNYATLTTPNIYSPTTSPFSSRSFKPVQPTPKPMLHMFRRLPQEIYDCILGQLQLLHTTSFPAGCITCFMRDLHSLALTSRLWEKAVRGKLYNQIHIQGNDSAAQLKKYKWKRWSRLKLLRRSLRERKLLANLVLELRVPELDMSLANGKYGALLQEYRDLIASIVMVCPNFERLLGFSLPYTHEFDRLSHALSTRKRLKEHSWIIGENPEVAERSKYQASGLLDELQVFQFLNYHVSWSHLETLMVHSLDSKGVLDYGMFLRMLNFLPSLRHLYVSCLDAEDFTDRSLLFLPSLMSLRLESLRGVTDTGLSHYVSRPEARNLRSLTLVDQNISSLRIISKILASLRSLVRFNIVQPNTVPTLPEGDMVFQPLLASSSLKYLHWDVATPNPTAALGQLDSSPFNEPFRPVDTPNYHLAQSILNAGFPSLLTLRAPLDIEPLGALQAVCRPTRNGQIMLPADRYSLPRSSHGSIPKRPLAMPNGNNLVSARIRAQTLIDKVSNDSDTGIKVVVTDHSGAFATRPMPELSDSDSESELDEIYDIINPQDERRLLPVRKLCRAAIKVHEFTLPACMGRVGGSAKSSMTATIPKFKLCPDITGSDADGGLISWSHVLSSNQTLLCAPLAAPGAPGRVNTDSSGNDDVQCPSPTSSRFPAWASVRSSSRNSKNGALPSPTSPTSVAFPSTPTPGGQPFWPRDMCNGSWNQGHRLGKEWWSHVERERLGSDYRADMVRLEHFF